MDRRAHLLSSLTRASEIVEIGGSHSPLVPKQDGWSTCVVDHASREDLIAKYGYKTEVASKVEDVDVVWAHGRLHEAFPDGSKGKYDAIVASHVIEHIPNVLGFLQSCEFLLKPTGRVILAIPDKRRCFDFFGSLSTSGDVLDAFYSGNSTHTPKTAFEEVAYAVARNGRIGWGAEPEGDVAFVHSLRQAESVLRRSVGDRHTYFDFHAWRFVGPSFEQIILELSYLGYIDLRIQSISPLQAQEFFVELVKGREGFDSVAQLNAKRLSLMKQALKAVELQLGEIG